MGKYEELFKFAAKAGALEGYLYQRDKLDPLSNWVNNIESLYRSLPDEVRRGTKEEYDFVLRRILTNGQEVLTEEIKSKLNVMLSEL